MLEDTLSVFERGSYEVSGKNITIKLSKDKICQSEVILPDQVRHICDYPRENLILHMGRCSFFCENTDSYTAAIRFKHVHPNEDVLVLNFANPVHPGGGVRKGANAQEEDLCRKSSLLLGLEDKAAQSYYEYNESLNTYMGSNAIILSPFVEIIKDENGNLLEDSVVVSVMTCAAPMISKGIEGMTQEEYEKLIYDRIVGMLCVAAHYGYNNLVLGAWGCGAFGNDAKVVSRVFYNVLREFKYGRLSSQNLFSAIFFAVLDYSDNKYNYNSFQKYFSNGNYYKEEDEIQNREILDKIKEKEVHLDKIKGSLFGGAIGDALGYHIEFMKEDQIFKEYGKSGITEYFLNHSTGKAHISDDTQMTLFTANGIIVGDTRLHLRGIGGIPHDYLRKSYSDWLQTQEITKEQMDDRRKTDDYYCISWLCDVPELYSRRAPGNTCISAIHSGCEGDVGNPINNSKGCGGIMRVAPLGLYYSKPDIEWLDMEAAQIAALTHGHSLGYMSASVLTHIISRIVYPNNLNMNLEEIVIEARDAVHSLFVKDEHITELDEIINRAIELSHNADSDLDNIHKLGEGWVAEETLAIALYCSLKYQNDFSKGVLAAVNHNGDSDSTGAVTGNIIGALIGYDAIEEKWKKNLELSDVIEEMSIDLCHGCMMSEYGSYKDNDWIRKYIHMKWRA
jgi:uncharacterized protein (TIGR02452 family)